MTDTFITPLVVTEETRRLKAQEILEELQAIEAKKQEYITRLLIVLTAFCLLIGLLGGTYIAKPAPSQTFNVQYTQTPTAQPTSPARVPGAGIPVTQVN